MAFGFGFALTAIAKAVGFTPQSLFTSGAQGAWYDPSDLTTLFEDSAGTTPITSPLEKPVGLMLDKSKGLVLGSEVLTPSANSDFSSDTGYWTKEAGWSITGGKLVGTNLALNNAVYKSGSLTANTYYEVTLVVDSISSGSIQVYVGPRTGTIITTAGTYTQRIATGSGNQWVGVGATTAGTNVVIDSISYKPVTGNHAYQSTTTSRPTLSARKNLLVGTATLSTQSVTTTAVGYVLSFYGTGSVTLSGTSTAGPLNGTGVNDRVSLTFTPTAGTLTLTVSGSVTKAQLEMINETV